MTAPWIARQVAQLQGRPGHAWLLQGAAGLGQYDLALALVKAWLCDRPTANGACGECDSCHQVDVRSHTDLRVLMPETIMEERGWPLDEKAQSDIDEKKRKPSKEIRIDALRDTIEFSQRTSGRGRGKAVLVYPAERMNGVTANALLKTLEEPPGNVRFVLATEAAHLLLPTIRSRCLGHTLAWPQVEEGGRWLEEQGVPAAAVPTLLQAAGQRPESALRLHQAGVDGRAWSGLPSALARGDVSAVSGWPASLLVDTLQKVCHDALAVRCGGAPRFFAPEALPRKPRIRALVAWSRSLATTARTVEHPFHAGLFVDALVTEARAALNSPGPQPRS